MSIPNLWTFKFALNKENLFIFEEALMTHGATVSWTAKTETSPIIDITVIFPLAQTNQNEARLFVNDLLVHFGISLPEEATIEQLEHRDWLMENRQSFPPLTIGSFFIYGSHYDGALPNDKIPLKLDASLAFGSGEHATTKGCLLMMEELFKKKPCDRFLDMGCGSSILTLGAAKLQRPNNWVAVDVDHDSVLMARQNLLDNGIDAGVDVLEGDGYHALQHDDRFDFVVSNILASPLIQMAPQLSEVLCPGGMAILSGFLETQKEDVIRAHQAVGLNPVQEALEGEWAIVAFRKDH
jgi:ribosomal protein L11 methyltransferase